MLCKSASKDGNKLPGSSQISQERRRDDTGAHSPDGIEVQETGSQFS